MDEVILSIEETSFTGGSQGWETIYEGFLITTNKQQIRMGIDNDGKCCENWGFFMTNDDLQEFIGARLLEVKIVDACLNVEKAPDIYEGDVMFVNFETSHGTLQFTAYNEHNGYYSHEVVVKCSQLDTSQYL